MPITRRRLRLHPPGVRVARQKGALSPFRRTWSRRSAASSAVDPKTVEVVLRSRFAGWRGLFAIVLPRHALAGENLDDGLERPDRQPEDGRADRERALPRRALGARQEAHASPEPPLLGVPSRLPRSARRFASCATPRGARRVRAERRGATSPWGSVTPSIVAELRRSPGSRVLGEPGTAGSSTSSSGSVPGGHPALESKLVRRALAYGIDRVAIVRQLHGDVDPRLRAARQHGVPDPEPYYAPNWREYRYRPALGAPAARAGRLPARLRRHPRLRREAALASLRALPPVSRLRARVLELVQAQLRQVGRRGRADASPPGRCSSTRSSRAATSTSRSSTGSYSPRASGGRTSSAAEAVQNYTGYCQRLVTRDLDQAERILDEASARAVLNRADRQLAEDVPVIPLYQSVALAAHRTTVRGVVFSPVHAPRERGELVARRASASRGDRRLAPRRLGSGRRGRADAEARRHASSFGPVARAGVPQRRPQRCGSESRLAGSSTGPRMGRIRRRSRLHVPAGPRLGRRRSRRRRRTRSRTTSDPRRAGATASRSRRGTSSSRTARSVGARSCGEPMQHRAIVRSVARRRREDGQGRPARPASPAGVGSVPVRPAAHALAGEDLATVWTRRHRQSEDGQADRERPVPRRSAGSAGSSSRSSATRATGGRTRPTSTGSSSASAGSARSRPPSRLERLRTGELDSSRSAALAASRFRSSGGSAGTSVRAPRHGTSWEHLDVPRRLRRASRAAEASSCARRSPTGSTASRSSRRAVGRGRPALPAARQRRLPRPAAATIAPNWSGYRYRPAERAAAARAGGLPAR